MNRSRARTAGGVAAVTVAALACAALGYGETRASRTDVATPRPSVASAAALAGSTGTPTVAATPSTPPARGAAVAAALARPLAAAGLGSRVRAEVVDVTAGRTVLDRGGAAAAAPASTAKLLTAAAVLTARGPDYRIATSVVLGAGGAVVLVGHGDPTLTGASARQRPTYSGAARLRDLATAITRAGVRPTRIVVDDAAFSGPAVSPSWDATDVPTEYGAAITATMTDGGRASPSATVRSATPDLAAGTELAALLGRPRLSVSRGVAPAGARVLGTVRSAPVSTLVAQMLTSSDNVIAECLGRQVAMARGRSASFTGAAAAIRATVRTLGVDPGTGMRDASGLAATDRLSARTLADLLAAVVRRRTGPLGDLVAGLPVAAWSGSLAGRYLAGSARAGAGVVRAKTGTLTGVSALAGLVHDAAGRLLAFAFIADRNTSTPAAEAALDDLASALATCRCSS